MFVFVIYMSFVLPSVLKTVNEVVMVSGFLLTVIHHIFVLDLLFYFLTYRQTATCDSLVDEFVMVSSFFCLFDECFYCM